MYDTYGMSVIYDTDGMSGIGRLNGKCLPVNVLIIHKLMFRRFNKHACGTYGLVWCTVVW